MEALVQCSRLSARSHSVAQVGPDVIWQGAGELGRRGRGGAATAHRRLWETQAWMAVRGSRPRPPAHLLVQAEPREGQKQHQTQPGPTNQRRHGDVGREPEVASRHHPSPPAGSAHPEANSPESTSSSSLPRAPPSDLLSLPGTEPALLSSPPLTCPPTSPSLLLAWEEGTGSKHSTRASGRSRGALQRQKPGYLQSPGSWGWEG